MRVIAGTAKGTRLAPVPPGVRPVSDMAREGLFSSLGAEVLEARVLDLWAGTGALAIEALSRGAASAVLVDKDRGAVGAIARNLEKTHLGDRAKVERAEVGRFLGTEGALPYDLVFADPPYGDGSEAVLPVLERLAGGVASGTTLVLTRPKGNATDVIPLDFPVARRLEYGDTLVLVCRRR